VACGARKIKRCSARQTPSTAADAKPARILYAQTMNIRPYQGITPRLGANVYIDPAAHLIGDVEIGDDASLWPCAVARGDVHYIKIGARTNVQDGAVLHVTHDGEHTAGGFPLVIGADVTIGHAAVVHACTLMDACLIGMHATVLDGVVVNRHSMIGAGAVVTPGKIVGEGELWVGNPARCVRQLSDEEIERLYYSARHYVKLKNRYLANG
jgi:carbonic anhydrase/acetyltransferase-like protein (isoleucine patch superfamily)